MRNSLRRAATWTIGAVLATAVVQAFRPGLVGADLKVRTTPNVVQAFRPAFEFEPASGAARQDHPQAPHRHPEAETLVNAVARTPESVKAGSALYAKLC